MNIEPTNKMNDLPKKPLSAYNLFFQYHRIKILQAPEGSDPTLDHESGNNENGDGNNSGTLPGLEGVDPSSPILSKPEAEIRKYRKNVIDRTLKENPFRINNEKRSHVKTHGKMSFLDMSKHMGRKWKQADEGTRAIFRQLANEGKAKFNKSVCESYKAACNKFCGKPMSGSSSSSSLGGSGFNGGSSGVGGGVAHPSALPPPALPRNVTNINFSDRTISSSPKTTTMMRNYQMGVGELHNMLQNVEWASGDTNTNIHQNRNRGGNINNNNTTSANFTFSNSPAVQAGGGIQGMQGFQGRMQGVQGGGGRIQEIHGIQAAKGGATSIPNYYTVQGIQRMQYVNPILSNGAMTYAAQDLVDRPYSLVDKREEIGDDEFKRLLNQLDWSRLEGNDS